MASFVQMRGGTVGAGGRNREKEEENRNNMEKTQIGQGAGAASGVKAVVKRAPIIVLIAAVAVMFAVSLIGGNIQRSYGSVETWEIDFVSDTGADSHAKIYMPKSAGADNPAPAVLLCHGYTVSLDAMEPYAIELSRRGYVVMALDLYGHGHSSLPEPGASIAEMGNVPDYAPDLGTYSALQQLKQIEGVDTARVAMLGHSMGSAAIQEGASIAYLKWTNFYKAAYAKAVEGGMNETDAAGTAYVAAMSEGIQLPSALVLTGYNYNIRNKENLTYWGVTPDNGFFPLYAAPVNICTIEADLDEFCELLWGTADAADYTKSFKFKLGTGGAEDVASGTYFMYGDPSATALSREQAVTAAQNAVYTMKPIRAAYSFGGTHSDTYFDRTALAQGIDFLDISLKAGVSEIAPDDQIWHGRAYCGLIGLIATFVAFAALALSLLNLEFFASACRPPAKTMSNVHSLKDGIKYAVFYIIFMLPAPFLYNWCIGYPYYMKPQGFMFLTKFMPTEFWNMAPMNSLMLLNIVLTAVFIVLYAAIVIFIGRKAGFGSRDMGIAVRLGGFFRMLLLAVVSYAVVYALVYINHGISGTYFSFFKFNIMPMDGVHWAAFFKYLPVWFAFFFVASVIFNTLTPINNAPAWVNYLLIGFVSFGGLLVLHALDYGTLFATGVRAFKYIPYTLKEGWPYFPFPTALAGIMLFGLLAVLPIGAVTSRLLYKKTGSVWASAFLVSFISLTFAISHMVISM